MPNPHALTITLSQRQHSLLQQITRRTTNPHRLVRRAQLILWAADGVNNSQISQRLQLHRTSVRLWRQRWQDAGESLALAEAGWIFLVDQLNTHQSASLVRRVAACCQLELDLGVKEKSGILKSMAIRREF